MSDFDVEPVRGLPARLPEGETMLWQGAPDWKALLRFGFHGRMLAIYFLLLVAWCAGSGWRSTQSVAAAGNAALWAIGLGLVFFALVTTFAWLVGRTTVYTITDHRVLIRFGVALQMTVNLPYTLVDTAGLRLHQGGCGDVTLAMRKGSRLSYIVMWPHVRPWRVGQPQPMLRAVPDAERVGRILGRALAAAADQTAPAVTDLAAHAGGAHPQAAAAA